MAKSKTVLAWHWVANDLKLQHTGEPVVAGQTYRVDPPIVACSHGLHASIRALDALYYAPGAMICRVRLGGEIVAEPDKLAASERTVLWVADATKTLHLFACREAEIALQRERKRGLEPDKRSWEAIRVKRLWVRGKASDAELAAAWAAAWDAAWDAALDAAWGAAWDAARVAAWGAARVAAWDAAWDAARAAAWDAAGVAAWGAAWDAARVAAWGAARGAANRRLERALFKLAPKKGGR